MSLEQEHEQDKKQEQLGLADACLLCSLLLLVDRAAKL
jgi:hypothetical protein